MSLADLYLPTLQWDLTDGNTIIAKNRAITGGKTQEDGAADLPLNYMQGLGG